MFEILKTVLLMSCAGGGVALVLLILKPLTVRKIPARWQYCIWLAVLAVMVLPVWKLIPKTALTPIHSVQSAQTALCDAPLPEGSPVANNYVSIENRRVEVFSRSVNVTDMAVWVWLVGMAVYLLLAFGSYCHFLAKKRRGSEPMEECPEFIEAKAELNIKRGPCLRQCGDIDSPMLVGILRPVVYISEGELSSDSLKMVFLHELTHYRRRDLMVKWLALVINAVHWFNPLTYAVSANINEACEISCDMAVTKGMSEEERKLYMSTILNLVEGGKI